MGLSLVMQSAYLQANIPQSLPFICCGISCNDRTPPHTSLPEEPVPRRSLQAKGPSQTSPGKPGPQGRAKARGDEGKRAGSRNHGGTGDPGLTQALLLPRKKSKAARQRRSGVCSPCRATTATWPSGEPATKGASGPKTKARAKGDPFSKPLPAHTYLAPLTQQRPAVRVKLFPFLVKTFLF